MSREELIATALAVGLVLGVDFEKNISSVNLQKKIDEKNAELEAQLKDVDLETPPTVDEVKDMQIAVQIHNESQKKIDESLGVPTELLGSETKGNAATDNLITDEKKIKELDDNALIKRETVCKSYRTKIKGFEEAARRSGVTVDEIKESIDSGNPIGGYLFTFIG